MRAGLRSAIENGSALRCIPLCAFLNCTGGSRYEQIMLGREAIARARNEPMLTSPVPIVDKSRG